jgi:hypothetical protein
MIVDPDFCDHWKTRMLVGALDGDECAPLYVLRLWAHCQNRRQSTFENISQEALKALCRFPGNSNKLESSLVTSGFVRREGKVLIVVGWDEYNSSLIAAWNNGTKGGRPPKFKSQNNPVETQTKPTGIPTGEPLSLNPGVCDKIRVDEIGEDNKKQKEKARGEEFQNCWSKWKRHLGQIQKPLSQITEETQLMQLGRIYPNDEDAIQAIEYSISVQAKNLILNGDHKPKPRAYDPSSSKQAKSNDDLLRNLK